MGFMFRFLDKNSYIAKNSVITVQINILQFLDRNLDFLDHPGPGNCTI